MERFVTKIGDFEYTTLEFSASESFELLLELADMAGPWALGVVEAMLDMGDADDLDFSELDPKQLFSLPGKILKSGGFEVLEKVLKKTARLDGERKVTLSRRELDTHFAGHLDYLLELCYKVLEHHYRPFLTKIGAVVVQKYQDFMPADPEES